MSDIGKPEPMAVSPVETVASRVESGARCGSLQWFGPKVSSPISLVLPMFNESAVVDLTLRQAIESLERDFADFEIVVADDASTDDSVERVTRWTERDNRIRLVRLAHNQRFGGALRAGLTAGAKEFLVYMDFDLPVALGSLPQLLQAFDGADVLTGYSADEVKHVDWKHVVISRGYNLMVRSLFGLKMDDINFGFKALRRSVWQQMMLHSCSPFVDAELFVRAQRLGARIKQISVPFSQRQMGTSHIRRADVIAATLLDMGRLRLDLWRRRP
jgi:glycosyltransferase involved in cell wall biosynthesis